MGEWIAFWNTNHSVYVNDRHRDVHYRRVAEDVAAYIPSRDATVVDYGSGEALHADRIAARAKRLILVEAASKVRANLVSRFGSNPKIEIRSPEQAAALADHTVDLVVLNSVAQYLTGEELDALLVTLHRMLVRDGLLVIGDVVHPRVSLATDVLALLRFAAAGGFLWAAVLGLLRNALSDYRRLRARLGLTRYEESELVKKLAAAGFSATRAPVNIGHNQARMTFIARAS